ncbi:hypothetical protein TcYC6_0003020 [Trypanosoma cruzi]|nr:hypothetical protein TcYC6_0003020 [Trypanosoma cruzi]
MVGVRGTLCQYCLSCSHTGHPNNPELSACLEEFRELLPTRVLHSADRFRAAAASHVVVQILVSDCEWWEQRTLSVISVCVFTHWTPNNPELSADLEEFRELLPTRVLHSADRFRAAAAITRCGPNFVSDCEWWESRGTLCQYLFACSHTGHQTTLNYPLLGGISASSCPHGAALG